MNKRITKKILAAFTVATLFVGGASAQILTDYVIQSGAGQTVDSVTLNSTTRLYVYPDMVYSPSYNAAANTGLGANERWTWYPSTDGSGVAIKAAANENWIEYTWTVSGTNPVSVIESNSAVACAGSVTTINVEVIDAPTVTFTVADGAGIFGSAAAPFAFCANDTRLGTDRVQATFTEEISGVPSLQVQYALTIDTSHSAGASWTNIAALTQTYSGAAGTQQAVTGTTHNLTNPAGGFVPVVDATISYPTRFTYTLNGTNDRISRKSNYLTNPTRLATGWSWYDTGAETLVIVVNPVPVTGPIYHISNMWAN